MRYLYETFIEGREKAYVGFVLPLVLGLVGAVGITGDMTVEQALTVGLTSVLTGLGVYLKRNN